MKKNIVTNIIVITIVFLLNSFTAQAKLSAPSTEKEVLYPVRITEKIKIDGALDEKTWQMPSLDRDFSSFSPHVGEILPYKTEVRMAYDNKNLYFAFLCHDPEPHKIKNSLAKRDNIDSDDRVGLSLDAPGTKQTAWAIFINPSGVQMDILYSAVSDTEIEPDIVWESAGKITGKGYQVECAVPLTSLSFESGDNVKMGILFWRIVPRLGISACWPGYVPGGKVFSTETDIIYRHLKKPLTLELLPNIFYSKSQERLNPTEWGAKDIFSGMGLDVKYGLTSSLTTDITYNPDFSQVESDTFQVEVNQRYPLFYAEKRPFFMEAATAFHFFTLGDGFFPRAVHTRQIVDPQWGIKLTGSVGKAAVGILAAGDEWPGRDWEIGDNPNKDSQAFYGIARMKYSLGDDSYIGFLYSGREFAGQFNRVFGADCLYRFLKYHRIQASFLQAKSSGSDPTNYDLNGSNGSNINFDYSLTTKNIEINAAFEHIGSDFRMDSAYLLRTGIDHGKTLALYNFLPEFKKSNWLKRITPMVIYRFIHDLKTGKNDFDFILSLEGCYSKDAATRVQYYIKKENWLGYTFDLHRYSFESQIQLTKWLQLAMDVYCGDNIYYESTSPFKGKWHHFNFFMSFQPLAKLRQQLNYNNVGFFKNGEKIYRVDILFSRTTYQFNKYLSLRAMLQYNSYEKRLMTDFLASFTLIPGTVFYIGYGGLYENRQWQNNEWLYRVGNCLDVKRTFFLKASYRWRF